MNVSKSTVVNCDNADKKVPLPAHENIVTNNSIKANDTFSNKRDYSN